LEQNSRILSSHRTQRSKTEKKGNILRRWKTCPSNADKSSGRRMSLNRSQYGGCSTGLQHPDRYLGRLRTISRFHVYLVVDQKPARRAFLHRSSGARLHQCGIARHCGKAGVFLPNNKEAPRYRCRSGRDANLEAFSYSPTDGSFAPLAARPSTCAKCPNLRFLSY
jgi:hypothetical protein